MLNTELKTNYGAVEYNSLDPALGEKFRAEAKTTVGWGDPRLAKIVRLRLLSDPGLDFWDISYCWGVLKSGTPVNVALPFPYVPRSTWGRKAKSVKAFLIDEAKRTKVFAKGLGLFEPGVISTLC